MTVEITGIWRWDCDVCGDWAIRPIGDDLDTTLDDAKEHERSKHASQVFIVVDPAMQEAI